MGKRILGIDYGTKYIGLAITDENNNFAVSYKIENNNHLFFDKLKQIVMEEAIGLIVIGFPTTFNNFVSQRHKLIEEFSKTIANKIDNLEVVLFDESYTTSTSVFIQKSYGLKNSQIEKTKDMSSAVLILEGYLKYMENNNSNQKV